MYACNVFRYNNVRCITHLRKQNAEGSGLQVQGAEAAPGPSYQQELARLSSTGNGSSNTRGPSVTIGGTVLTVVPTVIEQQNSYPSF